ncbi:hypothetical protein ASPVEDRAFT_89989 [Aspergillus versicolor CBS 583.65]|uniref:Uncharacterized protein n=1 Tax=Aspergillus versicolor CBS 583.65 TaxID=1036611 RepID=A0A1L9Q4W4_ASPVE|nr:uncharacterized protein ASPVEDRAFT_89989 [Aspergillus versicolor CBS 583.65]OJJ08779.1 hypothetical protein ASPVEDRAFT_89989 [Aspergillus versicolor CBS 583.65]
MPVQTKVILQSALLKAAANLTAQDANSSLSAIDWQSVAEFVIFCLIQAHLNCHWQRFLEDTFPTLSPARGKQRTTAWHNVLLKLALDQTIGLFIMNVIFLVCTNAVRPSSASLVAEVNGKIWPLIRNAWKVWPACALVNFLCVPVESRVLVASCVGFGWNVFLALFMLAK